MVRWLSLLVACAACYRGAPERDCALTCTTECPDGLVCNEGRCVSSVAVRCDGELPVDAPPPPPSCSFPTTFGGAVTLSVLTATDPETRAYNTEETDTIAVYSANGVIQIGQARAQAGFTTVAFVGFGARLSPEGDELFVQSTSDPLTFAVSRSSGGGGFSNPEVLTINGLGTLSAADIPGTPTARSVSPRRMMIGRQGGFLELRELSARHWEVGARYDPADLGMTAMTHPTLSPDGLRLVFVGPANMATAIYGATRASVDERFEPARVLYDATGDEDHAFLSADCEHLYYYVDGTVTFVAKANN